MVAVKAVVAVAGLEEEEMVVAMAVVAMEEEETAAALEVVAMAVAVTVVAKVVAAAVVAKATVVAKVKAEENSRLPNFLYRNYSLFRFYTSTLGRLQSLTNSRPSNQYHSKFLARMLNYRMHPVRIHSHDYMRPTFHQY